MGVDYNKDAPGTTWVEPPADYKGEYPYNNITQTESGHSFEMDDTPDYERIRLQHRSGTFVEFQADGKSVTHVFGDNYEVIAGSDKVIIKGFCNITIEGDAHLDVKGDAIFRGEKKLKMKVKGDVDIESEGDVNITSGTQTKITADSDVTIMASDGLRVLGDLFVSGGIRTNHSVSAAENILAGMKLHSNLGLDTLGGINCGFVTGGPNSPGVITATTSISVPYANFVYMKAILMTDNVNKSIYGYHIHISPKGPTTPPIIPMI